MDLRNSRQWLAGTAVLAILVMGCEVADEVDIQEEAAAEADVVVDQPDVVDQPVTNSDPDVVDYSSTELPINPTITFSDATRDKEIFLWKIPSNERGAVCRWPTAMYRHLGVTPENSFVMVNGEVRMDFYKIDEDIGAKISYRNQNMRTSSLPPHCAVILYKDGRPFAGVHVPNPEVRFETTLDPIMP